jgi:hypothetical protein
MVTFINIYLYNTVIPMGLRCDQVEKIWSHSGHIGNKLKGEEIMITITDQDRKKLICGFDKIEIVEDGECFHVMAVKEGKQIILGTFKERIKANFVIIEILTAIREGDRGYFMPDWDEV